MTLLPAFFILIVCKGFPFDNVFTFYCKTPTELQRWLSSLKYSRFVILFVSHNIMSGCSTITTARSHMHGDLVYYVHHTKNDVKIG